MSIQIKDKGSLVLTSNLLDGRNDIRNIRLELRNIDPAALRPYLDDARTMIMDELATVGAVILFKRDEQLAVEAGQRETAATAKADAIAARKAAWGRLWPISGRGAFDAFVKGVGIGELAAFNVADNGACKQWSNNAEWRDVCKRDGMQAGLAVAAGVVVVSVPVESGDAFAKRFALPKCLTWDGAGLRSFALALPAGGGVIRSNTGHKCRVTTADTTRLSFAPVEGVKIVTAPKQVAIDDQGMMPPCPAPLLATIKVAAAADPLALDEVLTA